MELLIIKRIILEVKQDSYLLTVILSIIFGSLITTGTILFSIHHKVLYVKSEVYKHDTSELNKQINKLNQQLLIQTAEISQYKDYQEYQEYIKQSKSNIGLADLIKK